MNPVVFFDFSLFDGVIGRVKIELEAGEAPNAAENFRQLCTGELKVDNRPAGYKGCVVRLFTAIPGVVGLESGNHDGRGGVSVHGSTEMVVDNLHSLKHDSPGTVSMLSGGRFAILSASCPALDGKHQVVGRVVEGMASIRKMEAILTDRSVPPDSVSVCQCGQMY